LQKGEEMGAYPPKAIEVESGYIIDKQGDKVDLPPGRYLFARLSPDHSGPNPLPKQQEETTTHASTIQGDGIPQNTMQEDDESLFLPSSEGENPSQSQSSRLSTMPVSLPIDISQLHASKRKVSDAQLAERAEKKKHAYVLVYPLRLRNKTDEVHSNKTMSKNRSCLLYLQAFNSQYILEAKAAAGNLRKQNSLICELHHYMQSMEYRDDLTVAAIETSKILEDGILQSVRDNVVDGIDFPWYVRRDAKALYRRWNAEDVEPSILRGLQISGKDRSYRAERDYMFEVSCDYHGEGNLINGQWFPYHLSAKIHGAHGNPDSGIHGDRDHGAFSIVLSSGYNNRDDGYEIKYYGTKAKAPGKPTPSTKYMMTAYDKKSEIRVLRSSGIDPPSQYRPSVGLRYDGLYKITSYNLMEEKYSHYRFNLKRIGGQLPIRHQDPYTRPSLTEVSQFELMKQNLQGS